MPICDYSSKRRMGIGEGYVFRTGNGWCENLRFLSSSLFFLSRPSFRLPLPRAAAPAETKLNQSPPPLAGSLFFLCFDKKEGGRGGRRGKGVWGNFLLFPPLKCECGLHGLGRRSPPLSSLFAFGCFWFMSVGKTTSGGGGSRGGGGVWLCWRRLGGGGPNPPHSASLLRSTKLEPRPSLPPHTHTHTHTHTCSLCTKEKERKPKLLSAGLLYPLGGWRGAKGGETRDARGA